MRSSLIAVAAMLLVAIIGCRGSPTAAPPYAPGAGLPGISHVVAAGDTLTNLSARYGVSVEVIAAANRLRSHVLVPGAILNIPGGRVAPPPPVAAPAPPPQQPAASTAWFKPRSAWATARVITSLAKPMERPYRITVHHSGSRDDLNEPADRRLPKIERVHQAQQWACIGYHFILDGSGQVWEGRPLVWQGAHAHGDENNRGNIGVCVLGDYEVARVPPALSAALHQLLDRLCSEYSIDKSQVHGHRDLWSSTDCPGRFLSRDLRAWSGGLPAPASPLVQTRALER